MECRATLTFAGCVGVTTAYDVGGENNSRSGGFATNLIENNEWDRLRQVYTGVASIRYGSRSSVGTRREIRYAFD